ncbi:MAG: selenocysteine-specific translation elongation factor, partial [Candidatus Hydrogenedentota bacterium]
MNYLTMGVIGHVDHGKTSLVKALTGVDTDRLKEEKERGISIALGYTYLDVPDGKIGVVDVPGHEKLIRTMVSGATGIRAVLLALDVNEGAKPQTKEHIQIAEILGIKHGVIAITKCDTADEEMWELAALDIQDYLEGTFLENAPLVYTSSQSGEGLDELKETLGALLSSVDGMADNQLPYLPVDRVFSLSGFGTVVTGTLRRGTIFVDDRVMAYPGGEKVRIRELQSHGEQVESVQPGMRTAVNVRGSNKLELKRGDALAPEGTLGSGMFATCALTLFAGSEVTVKQRQQIRVLWGTTEVVARVHILGGESVVSGETTMVQMQFEAPVCSMFRERAVVRSYSPVETIGGAVLLEFGEKRLKRKDSSAVRHAEILHSADSFSVLAEVLLNAPDGVLNSERVGATFGYPEGELSTAWGSVGAVSVDSAWVAHPDRIEELQQEIQTFLKGYHKSNPTQWGPSEDQLREQLGSKVADRLVTFVIKRLIESKSLSVAQGLVHLADFRAGGALTDDDRAIVDEIEAAFREGGLRPPGVVDVLRNDKERMRLYRYLVEKKTLYATGVAN